MESLVVPIVRHRKENYPLIEAENIGAGNLILYEYVHKMLLDNS